MKKKQITLQGILKEAKSLTRYMMIGVVFAVCLGIGIWSVCRIVASVENVSAWGELVLAIFSCVLSAFALHNRVVGYKIIKHRNFEIYDTVVVDKQTSIGRGFDSDNHYLVFNIPRKHNLRVGVEWQDYNRAKCGNRYYVIYVRRNAYIFSAKEYTVCDELKELVKVVK